MPPETLQQTLNAPRPAQGLGPTLPANETPAERAIRLRRESRNPTPAPTPAPPPTTTTAPVPTTTAPSPAPAPPPANETPAARAIRLRREARQPVVQAQIAVEQEAQVQQAQERGLADIQVLLPTEGLDTTAEERVAQVEDLRYISRVTNALIRNEQNDADAQQLGFQLLANYGEFLNPLFVEQGIDPQELAQLAVEADVNLDEYQFDYMPKASWWQRGLEAVMSVPGVAQFLEYADRPSQGILTALALAFHDDEDRSGAMLGALGRGFTFQDQPEDFYGVDIDQDEDTVINFREVLGIDPEAGGRWAGVADMAAVIATDPLTWVWFAGGGTNMVRQGTTATVRRFAHEGGEDALRRLIKESGLHGVARAIHNGGDDVVRAAGRSFDSFDEAYEYVRQGVRESAGDMFAKRAEVAGAVDGVQPTLRQQLLRGVQKWDKAKIDRKADLATARVESGGRSGIRLAGRYTVLPYGRLASKVRLRDTWSYFAEARPLSKLKPSDQADTVTSIMDDAVIDEAAQGATRAWHVDTHGNIFDNAEAAKRAVDVNLPGPIPGTDVVPFIPPAAHPAHEIVAALQELALDPKLQDLYGVTPDQVAAKLKRMEDKVRVPDLPELPAHASGPFGIPTTVSDGLGRFQAARRFDVQRRWDIRHGRLGNPKPGTYGSRRRPWGQNTDPLSLKEHAGRWSSKLDDLLENSWNWSQLRRRLTKSGEDVVDDPFLHWVDTGELNLREEDLVHALNEVSLPNTSINRRLIADIVNNGGDIDRDALLDKLEAVVAKPDRPPLERTPYHRQPIGIHVKDVKADEIGIELRPYSGKLPPEGQRGPGTPGVFMADQPLYFLTSRGRSLDGPYPTVAAAEAAAIRDFPDRRLLGEVDNQFTVPEDVLRAKGLQEADEAGYAGYTRAILEEVFKTKNFTDEHLRALLASSVDWTQDVAESGVVPWGATVNEATRDLMAKTTVARIAALNPGLLDAVSPRGMDRLVDALSDMLARVDFVTGSLDDPNVQQLIKQAKAAAPEGLSDAVVDFGTGTPEVYFAVVRGNDGNVIGAARLTDTPLTRADIDIMDVVDRAPRELEGMDLHRWVQGQLAAVIHGVTGPDDELLDLIGKVGDALRRGRDHLPSLQRVQDRIGDILDGDGGFAYPHARTERFIDHRGVRVAAEDAPASIAAAKLGVDAQGFALNVDGEELGWLITVRDPVTERWIIDKIEVRPEYQRQGVADELMARAERELETKIFHEGQLDRLSDQGRAFAEARGGIGAAYQAPARITGRRVAAAAWVNPEAAREGSTMLGGEITRITGRAPSEFELWGVHDIFRMLTASTDPDELRRIVNLLEGDYEWERALNAGVPPRAIPPSTGPGGALELASKKAPWEQDVNFRFGDEARRMAPGDLDDTASRLAFEDVTPEGLAGTADPIAGPATRAVREHLPTAPDAVQIRATRDQEGLLDMIYRSEMWEKIEQAFVTVNVLRRSGGADAAARYKEAQAAARVSIDVSTAESFRRLLGAQRRALKEWDGDAESLHRWLNDTFASKEAFDTNRAWAVAKEKDRLVEAVDTLQTVRREVYNLLGQSGVDKTQLQDLWDYIPHAPSAQAEKIGLDKISEALHDHDAELAKLLADPHHVPEPSDLGSLSDAGFLRPPDQQLFRGDSFLQQRKLFAGEPDIFAVNARAQVALKKAGIDLDELFTTDLFQAFSMRSRSAFQTAGTADLLTAVSEIIDKQGRRLAYVARNDDWVALDEAGEIVARAGDARKNAAWMNEVGFDPDVVRKPLTPELAAGVEGVTVKQGDKLLEWMAETDEFLSGRGIRDYDRIGGEASGAPVEGLIVKDLRRDLDAVQDIIYDDELQRTWMRHMDAWSNAWGIYATVPLVGGLAFHARNALGNISLAYLSGLHNPYRYVQAFNVQRDMIRVRRRMAKTGESWDDVAAGRLNPATGVREGGLLDPTMVTHLRAMREDGVLNIGFFDDLDRNMPMQDEFNRSRGRQMLGGWQDNLVTKPGKWVGATVEDNARLAVYLDEIAKTGDRVAARNRVRTYLFDYRDLTNAESQIRRVSRFYTWLRKNTAVHAAALAATPGRVLNTERMAEAIGNALFGEPGEGDSPRLLDDWAVREGLTYRPGLGGMVGIETPFKSAAETVLRAFAPLQSIPEIRERVPEALRYEDAASAWRDALQLFVGGPVSAVMLATGGAADRDLFTGGPASRGQDYYWDILDVIAPIGGKTRTTGARAIETIGNILSEEEAYGLELANLLLGVHIRRVDTVERQMALLNSVRAQVANLVEEARQRGVDLPTQPELRAAGVIGELDVVLRSQFNEDPEYLLQHLPKSFREELGFDVSEAEVQELTSAEREEHLAELVRVAEEYIGGPLTQDQRRWLAFNSAYSLNQSEQEFLGIYEQGENVFWKEDAPAPEFNRAYLDEQLASIERGIGVAPGTLLANNPFMPTAEKVWRDAVEAGVSSEEVVTYLHNELLSRTNLYAIYGPEFASTITPQTRDRAFTEEDLRKTRTKALELAAEYSVLMRALGVSVDETGIAEYVYGTLLTVDQEERVFGERLLGSVPNRVDISTEAEKQAEAEALANAARAGLEQYLPPPTPVG